MIELSLSAINSKSPYKLEQTQTNSFVFVTDCGNIYEVGLVEDSMFGIDNTYQFFITDKEYIQRKEDIKIKFVVIAILEEFFKNDDVILDYICLTEDGRQAVRNRLFLKWFAEYEDNSLFECKTISKEFGGITYYAAAVFKKDTMLYRYFIDSINSFEKDLLLKAQ